MSRFPHLGGDDVRGLVGGEDELHAGEWRVEKGADLRAVGGDGKIEVARTQDQFVAAGFHARVGADAERGDGGPRGFARPLVQGLAEQGERGDEDEDAWHGLSSLRGRDRRLESLRHIFGDPQGHERLAGAAGHERGGAILLAECGENCVKRFALVRERNLAGALDFRAFQPRAHRGEVRGRELVKIIAGDGVEPCALADHAGERVAICDEHARIGPIRDADEGGKLRPIQRRTPGAELRLIRVNLAKLRLDDTVHAHVGGAQGEALAQRVRDARSRPDGLCLLDCQHSKIRLRENLEGSTTFLCGRERDDACFQFAKTFQPVENPALQIDLRFGVGWEFHHRGFHTKQNLPRIPIPLRNRNS